MCEQKLTKTLQCMHVAQRTFLAQSPCIAMGAKGGGGGGGEKGKGGGRGKKKRGNHGYPNWYKI